VCWASVGAPPRHFRLAAVLVGVWLALLVGAPNAAADPVVTFECTPAPANCSGWYRSNVSINWTVAPSTATVLAGCTDRTFTTDTPGSNQLCRASDEGTTVTIERVIQVDKTAPVVTGGTPARAADVNGWYNHAVPIAFSGSDLTSGVAACTSTTYGGPDRADASVTGTCLDQAGNTSAPLGYGLKYDATAPVLTGATPERPPNAGGWFSNPVRFDIQATDATSGIADCPPVTYGGPDSATASFNASCRDLAGNSASRSFALKYNATPSVSAVAPVAPIPPGRPHLLGPRPGFVVRAGHPPLLRWTPVRGAGYYNLQLSRRGRKILSVWPAQPHYQVKRKWSYGGRKWRLVPGRYRWVVWPGFGPRSKSDYGRRIGSSTFRVVARR
jgi:hypothetical protein